MGFFEIDADVSKKYNEYVLKPINDKESLDFLASLGIKKMFQGEMFFNAVDLDQFLGRPASFNLIGTIDNRIYKIYFKFIDDNRSDCISFRNEIRSHLADYIPSQQFINPQVSEIHDGRLTTWHFEWGNILLEELYVETGAGPGWTTAIAITSRTVRNAKKLGFLDKIFNRS